MAWFDCATKKELQPESDAQPAIKPTQVIFHSIAAPWTPQKLFEYWSSSESEGLESHFGVGYDGTTYQYVGTETRADANYSANRRVDGTGAISVETASTIKSDDKWTVSQVNALINIGVEAYRKHGIPLVICKTWDSPGFGIHRMFSQWSKGGTDCPGVARAQQFQEVIFPGIVARATARAQGKPQDKPLDIAAEIALLQKRLDALEAKMRP